MDTFNFLIGIATLIIQVMAYRIQVMAYRRLSV